MSKKGYAPVLFKLWLLVGKKSYTYHVTRRKDVYSLKRLVEMKERASVDLIIAYPRNAARIVIYQRTGAIKWQNGY